MSSVERIEAEWIDSFCEVFRLCGVQPGDACAVLSETQSRPVLVSLSELALARPGARWFHGVLPTPRQAVPVPAAPLAALNTAAPLATLTPDAPLATLNKDAPLAHLRWDSPTAAPGPLVVLLHGVGGGREAWGAAGSGSGTALAAAGFTAVAVDFPGYGLSAAVQPYDLAGIAAAVGRLIASLGLGPAVLVGHSMGGMVAQELAARSPAVVAGLVLVNTSPAFGKPGGDWQRDFLQSRFAPLDAGSGMAGLAAQLVSAMLPTDAPASVRAGAQALMAAVPEATYRSAVAALVAFDRRADLPQVSVPTLVITGELDQTAAPEVARRMAERIPGAVLQTVPGAGHLLPMERPDAFNTALLAFLARR